MHQEFVETLEIRRSYNFFHESFFWNFLKLSLLWLEEEIQAKLDELGISKIYIKFEEKGKDIVENPFGIS